MSNDERPTPSPQSVADRFSGAAEQYAQSEQRGGDDLAAVVAAVAAAPTTALVVDVATGPGSTALALAGVAGRVVGTDLSPGMVAKGHERAAEAGITNATFEVADAEHLPFADGEVDVVTCRIAAHHFPDVPAWLREVTRVLGPRGRLVLLDSEAPEDAEVAAFLERIEIRRDPTHVHAFTASEWQDMIVAAGFVVTEVQHHPKPKAFEPWLERGGVDAEAEDEVRRWVRDAPPAVVAALHIEHDADGAPVRFADEKVLVVADRAQPGAAPGTMAR